MLFQIVCFNASSPLPICLSLLFCVDCGWYCAKWVAWVLFSSVSVYTLEQVFKRRNGKHKDRRFVVVYVIIIIVIIIVIIVIITNIVICYHYYIVLLLFLFIIFCPGSVLSINYLRDFCFCSLRHVCDYITTLRSVTAGQRYIYSTSFPRIHTHLHTAHCTAHTSHTIDDVCFSLFPDLFVRWKDGQLAQILFTGNAY